MLTFAFVFPTAICVRAELSFFFLSFTASATILSALTRASAPTPDFSLLLFVHVREIAAFILRALTIFVGLLAMPMGNSSVTAGLFGIAGFVVPGRLAVMVRGRLVVKSRIMMMRCSPALATRFGRLFGIPLVGIPALMGSTTALASDLALTFFIHGSKSAAPIARHDLSSCRLQ
jgi:hypothetical protein